MNIALLKRPTTIQWCVFSILLKSYSSLLSHLNSTMFLTELKTKMCCIVHACNTFLANKQGGKTNSITVMTFSLYLRFITIQRGHWPFKWSKLASNPVIIFWFGLLLLPKCGWWKMIVQWKKYTQIKSMFINHQACIIRYMSIRSCSISNTSTAPVSQWTATIYWHNSLSHLAAVLHSTKNRRSSSLLSKWASPSAASMAINISFHFSASVSGESLPLMV